MIHDQQLTLLRFKFLYWSNKVAPPELAKNLCGASLLLKTTRLRPNVEMAKRLTSADQWGIASVHTQSAVFPQKNN